MKGKGFHISQRNMQEYVKDVFINIYKAVQREAALRQNTLFPEKGFTDNFLASLIGSPY